jgi:hypothetical protein
MNTGTGSGASAFTGKGNDIVFTDIPMELLCWCCPLSRVGELRVLYNDFPELWEELKELDKKSFRQFRSDYSVKDLSEKFAKEKEVGEEGGRIIIPRLGRSQRPQLR